MSTTSTGQAAETAAAEYYQAQGYTTVARNWKTRYCEIDIIARKNNTLYFIEVKYRSNAVWGDGLAYITPAKVRQMHFAASLYLADKPNFDAVLAAVAVSGPDFTIADSVVLD